MATLEPRGPLQPGEPAPDFSLPAVNSEGLVALADYRGRSPVLVASRPFVRPVADEVRRIATHTVQQGLFVIDGDGMLRYTYVTTPTGPLPPVSTLLAVLDGIHG